MTDLALDRRLILSMAAAVFASAASIQTAAAQPRARADGNLFGLVEIGSSGVKPSIVRILSGDEPDLQVVKALTNVEANAIDTVNAPIVARAVKSALDAFAAEGIGQGLTIVVGSSGVASVPAAKEAVAEAVRREVGLEIGFVSVEDEVRYTFDGVVNRVRLAHRRPQVVLVDIGSGNTKGGYVIPIAGVGERFQTFSTPLGVKSFSRAVQAKRGGAPMAEAARQVAEQDLRPALRRMIATEGGPMLLQRDRVYLTGGLPWALATTQNPRNTDRYVPISIAQIQRFTNQATTDQIALFNVDTAAIPSPGQRTLIEGDLKRLREQVFTPDEFVCGGELLRVLSEEMGFARRTVFFARPGRMAWLMGVAFNRVADGTISEEVLPTA